jgi:transmembrane sensor
MEEKDVPYELIAKHLSGETSGDEDEKLWNWLEERAEHLKCFQSLVAAYNYPVETNFDVPESKISKIEVTIPTRGYSLWLKIAASILFVALVGVSLIVLFKESEVTFETASGEVKQFLLPDSTEVWLNGNSSLSFEPMSFADHRQVVLNGEAFFFVRQINSSCLEILYDSTLAQIHSGSIDIESYNMREEKRAVVSEGVVTFVDLRKDGFSLTATSGETVTSLSDYGILSVENNDDLNFDSWKTGVYAFEDVTLKSITDVLLKGSDTTVVFQDQDLKYQLYSGVFESTQPGHAFRHVLTSLDASLEYRDGGYCLNRKIKL